VNGAFAHPFRFEVPLRARRYRRRNFKSAAVSADFREHPVSVSGPFGSHDRPRFETLAISLRPDDSSEMQKRLKGAFDQFLDVSAMDDRDVAALLRAKKVHIAVDLMGYTQHALPSMFAWRAAPIQVSYLGYQGTTGSEHIDYAIADPTVLPLDQHDALWAGLPVLTCLGRTFAGRAAASLLRAVGRPELVSANLEEYEALACKLALEPSRLLAIRSKLASNRFSYPLFDT
jgi:predicted O-linked N-acetylglucosamine transferase (SPINDLY family)